MIESFVKADPDIVKKVGSMLVLLIVALRFVNPTQLVTRVGDDGA